ncbi:2'-5' RNA ligase family protein [Phycicoccus sp.]|uniref:2'-5' RNA ligase family protein n=1 Tax=Phycicoccus sp. TaxID=1902410 RepID=UPI002B798041|nr:2'-5' RNA ligase family protein [Phycicoccus sp.]HMM95389.1 2'-5' RNA ligase family protein [Phycicoccus sp.]
MTEVKAGGADRNRGNAERLRHYWVRGEGAARIGWGTDGDFMRCVAELTPHLGVRAKGYCNLRHQEAVGAPPGKGHGHKALAGPGDARDDTAQPSDDPTGVMIALYPSFDVATQLADIIGDDAQPVGELHVTLAFLGELDEVDDPDALIEIVRGFAEDAAPIDGTYSGFGRFTIPDGDAFYASVDVPELSAFREDLLDLLDDEGVAWRTDHGFTPHTTLAYLDPDEPNPFDRMDEVIPVTFDMISVAVAGDVWDFPLNGDPATDDEEGEPGDSPAEEAPEGEAPPEVPDDEIDADPQEKGGSMAELTLRAREGRAG